MGMSVKPCNLCLYSEIASSGYSWVYSDCGVNVLRISVRTDETKLISRAFTLASSRWPPKPGSEADAVQPTVEVVSVCGKVQL
jgi:hypothetical protein